MLVEQLIEKIENETNNTVSERAQEIKKNAEEKSKLDINYKVYITRKLIEELKQTNKDQNVYESSCLLRIYCPKEIQSLADKEFFLKNGIRSLSENSCSFLDCISLPEFKKLLEKDQKELENSGRGHMIIEIEDIDEKRTEGFLKISVQLTADKKDNNLENEASPEVLQVDNVLRKGNFWNKFRRKNS